LTRKKSIVTSEFPIL